MISETAPNEDQRILVASHRPGTGWSAVTTVTDNSVARERIPLGAAVNDSGAIEIAWIERFGVNRITVKLRTQEAGASFFGQTIDLVANENPTVQIFTPIFATNANGRAALAYQRSGSVRVHTRPGAGGAFGAAVTMANAPDISTSAPEALGISASGDVHVVINAAGSASSDDRTEARRLPVGGGWSAAARIDNPGTQPGSARIAYLDDTAVIVRAGRVGADQRVLQATRWRPGAEGPDGPRDLLPPGSDSLVVHDLQGDGRGSLLASVDRSSGMSGQRLLLPFDAAPPRLRTLNTPSGAIVGVPTALGAEFIDRWSPLGQISWDFGDGTGASGAAVTKTWNSPGIKTVTVTAADALGNSRSVRTEVNVAAVIADPPAPIDRTRPTIALTAPPCGGRARAACARYRAGTVAWRTLRGTARDNAGQTGLRVQVSLVRRDRGRVSALRAGAWRTMTARRANAVWIAARRSGPRWSYRAPRALPPGRYTVRVRAIDRAGNHSRVIVRTVRLR